MLMNEDEVKSSVITVEGQRVLFDKSNPDRMESIAAPPSPLFLHEKMYCTIHFNKRIKGNQ